MGVQKANKNDVRKEIAALIDSIKEQSDRIGTQREIPQSELDVILHRIEDLHRKTVVWSYLNTLPEEPVEDTWSEEMLTEKVEEPSVTEEKVSIPEPKAEVQQPEPAAEIKSTEPVIETVTQKVEQPVEQKTAVPEIPVVPPAPEKKTVQFKDMRSFIGFNEKIMYIRQVFGGDSAAYEEVLNQLNDITSYGEAEAFLTVLAKEYQWKDDHEPVVIFYQAVKRRFS